jgi:hypothetical protein
LFLSLVSVIVSFPLDELRVQKLVLSGLIQVVGFKHRVKIFANSIVVFDFLTSEGVTFFHLNYESSKKILVFL